MLRSWLLVAALSVLPGCGGSSPGPDAPPDVASLPMYTPQEAELFDDVIAPEVFGLEMGQRNPAGDPAFAERTRRADSVVRAKLSTLNRDTLGDEPSYQLVLRAIASPLAGRPPDSQIELRVPAKNPSITYLRAQESTFNGKTMVLFLRRYQENGEAILHFRAEADVPEIHKAVTNAKLLEEMGS